MDIKALKKNKFISAVYKVIEGFFKYDIASLAAELTFYLMAMFFPIMILIFIIVSHTTLIDEQMLWNFLSMFPDETANAVSDMLKNIAHTKTVAFTVVILSMWSMSGAMTVIAKGFNRFYLVKESRNVFLMRVIGMLFAIFVVVSVLASFVFLVYGELIGNALMKFFPFHIDLWNTLRWISPLAVITIVLAAIYKVVPNRRLSLKSVMPGALFATMCWGLSSMIFSYYANNFAQYHVLYGSVAGVVMLVTWLFMSSYVILIGGYLNAGIYRIIKKARREKEELEGDLS